MPLLLMFLPGKHEDLDLALQHSHKIAWHGNAHLVSQDWRMGTVLGWQPASLAPPGDLELKGKVDSPRGATSKTDLQPPCARTYATQNKPKEGEVVLHCFNCSRLEDRTSESTP